MVHRRPHFSFFGHLPVSTIYLPPAVRDMEEADRMDGDHLQEYWTIIKNWIEDEVGPQQRELCPALYMVEAALHTLEVENGKVPKLRSGRDRPSHDNCRYCGACRR